MCCFCKRFYCSREHNFRHFDRSGGGGPGGEGIDSGDGGGGVMGVVEENSKETAVK